MADIKWIKLTVDMFDDEKIRLIQAMPESDAILVIWIRLLSLAGKINSDGQIYIDENMAYTDEMLSTIFNKPINVVRLALNTLKSFGMIDIFDNGVIFINNWEKHQNVEGMEKIRIQNAERNKKYRDKKKQKQIELESDVSVTSRDGTELELDLELDKESNKDIVVPTEVGVDSKKTKDNQEKKESVPYKKIIEYLNNKVGSSLLFKAKGNQAPIKARWNEGYRLKDFELVIDYKFTDKYFKDNPQFFLPKTLFSNKFGFYLQNAKFEEDEKEKKKNKEENRVTPEQLFELERLENEKEAERRYGSKQNQ